MYEENLVFKIHKFRINTHSLSSPPLLIVSVQAKVNVISYDIVYGIIGMATAV